MADDEDVDDDRDFEMSAEESEDQIEEAIDEQELGAGGPYDDVSREHESGGGADESMYDRRRKRTRSKSSVGKDINARNRDRLIRSSD